MYLRKVITTRNRELNNLTTQKILANVLIKSHEQQQKFVLHITFFSHFKLLTLMIPRRVSRRSGLLLRSTKNFNKYRTETKNYFSLRAIIRRLSSEKEEKS
jgi:hypothetical protein